MSWHGCFIEGGKKMRLSFDILKVDLRLGFRQKWRWALLAVVYLAGFYEFHTLAGYYLSENRETLSLADALASIFKGAYPIVRNHSVMTDFALPTIWLFMMAVLLVMALDYPVKSLEAWGSQYITRIGRRRWWNSKCLYILVLAAAEYGMLLLETLILCRAYGVRLSWISSAGFYESIFAETGGVFSEALLVRQNLLLLVVLPLAGLITMMMIQLFLSVWVPAIFAYLLSIAALIFTVYSDTPFLPGNYLMAIRSGWIDPEGIPASTGMLYCVCISAGIWIAGAFLIRHRDLMSSVKSKEEE